MTSTVRGRPGRPRPRGEEPGEPGADDLGPDERPARRGYPLRPLVLMATALTVLGVGYLVLFSSMFGANEIEVTGVRTIPADTVRAAAAIEPGSPLVRLDTDQVRDRVAKLPKVFQVNVSRSFPGTVVIEVVERTPVAVAPASDGVHLVDGTGLDFEVIARAPAGLPKLTVAGIGPDDPATRAAVTVLAAVPAQLRGVVVEVTAKTPGDVQLALADGRLVKWGGVDASARKAAVLAPLLTRRGKVYDVATPDFPTVS